MNLKKSFQRRNNICSRSVQKYFFYLVVILYCYGNVIAQDLLSKDFPTLNSIYKADSKRADYIIVLDQSGSMKSYWQNVKNGVSALIKSLPNEDYVSVLGFSSECQSLVVPRKLNESSKNELISQITQIPNPTGRKTDLFEAIDKTLDEVNRPNSNELKFVFFLTDYINDPPNNTKWNSTNIHLLKEKYLRVVDQSERLLKLYALQLPLDIEAGKDYEKFANIFHSIASPIFLNQNTLIEWFERLRTEIEREKLRLLVEKDLKNTIAIEKIYSATSIIEKDSHIKLEIRNNSRLDLNLDSLSIITSQYGNLTKTFSEESIESGSTSEFKIELNEHIKSLPGFISTEHEIIINEIKVFVSSGETVEFGKLNLDPSIVFIDNNSKPLRVIIGYTYFHIILLLIVVGFLFWFLFYPCLKPVWLFNKRNIKVSMDINDKIVELNTREFKTNKNIQSFDNNIIVSDPQSQTGIRDEFRFKINFVAKKSKCIIRKPKPGTYVSVELPEDADYTFSLIDKVRGKGKEYRLSKELTSEPIDFRDGVRIESVKFNLGESYKLKIIINTKS